VCRGMVRCERSPSRPSPALGGVVAPSLIRSWLTVDAVDVALAASPGATSRALWSVAQTLVKCRFMTSEKRHSRHETGMKRLFNHVHLNTLTSASAQHL